jgi:arylsulfatase A-like enzyme
MKLPLFVSFLVSICLCPLLTSAEEPSRPNIILMMADDMGWSDIGCHGSEIATPNIDRISGEGMRFADFYNNAKCTTTRASLLTGIYPRNGGKGIELLNANMITLGEALSDSGYQTGMSGKWHNGDSAPHRPFDRGFQKSYGLWDGGSNFFDPSIPDPKFKGSRVRFFGEDDRRITEFPEGFYTTEAFTDHAIATIKAQVKAGEPFFHYLAYTAPHYPLHAKPDDIAKYRGRYDAGWDVLRKERRNRQIEMGIIDPAQFPESGPNPNNIPWESIPAKERAWEASRMEVYAAMVDNMDRNIGRLLATLEELKVDENTVVIFLSDNGGCPEEPGGRQTDKKVGPGDHYAHCGPNWAYAQNTPLKRYKSTTHEGGVATPMVVRWPNGIEAGSVSNQVGHIIDFMPTFLDIAGGDYPQSRKGKAILQEEGVSLMPILKGDAETIVRPAPLFWHWSKNRAVLEGSWKLVWEAKGKREWELYNLNLDRTETRDIAAQQLSKVNQLRVKWEAWAALTGVKY